MNEVIPRPSHPISKIIKCGMKIKRFIDKTNKITRSENRGRKGSDDMYVDVNNITLAEIINTTHEKAVPHGSIISVMKIGT